MNEIFSNLCTSFFRKANFILPLLYAILLCLFPPQWGFDSAAISVIASWGNPSPHLIYVGYLLSYPLMWARMLIPQAEWFSVFLYITSFLSIAVFSHCLVRCSKAGVRWHNVTGLIVTLLYMILFIRSFAYSSCSSTGMAAGLILMLSHASWAKRKLFACAFLLFIFSASIRYDSSPVFIPLAGMLILYYTLVKQWEKMRITVCASICIMSIYLIQPLFANITLWGQPTSYPKQNLIHINNARMSFCDYGDPHDLSKQPEYERLDFSVIDRELLATGASCTLTRRAQPGWIEELGKLRRKDNPRIPQDAKTLFSRLRSPYWTQLCIFALPLLLMAVFPLPRRCLSARFFVLTAGLVSYALLIIIGRVNFTGMLSILHLFLAVMVWGLREESDLALSPPLSTRCLYWLLLPGMLLIWLFSSILIPRWSPFRHPHYPRCISSSSIAISEELKAHPENIYLMYIAEWFHRLIPCCPLRSIAYREHSNVLPILHWMWLTPSLHSELKNRGWGSDLSLPFRDNVRIIAKPNHYLIIPWVEYWKNHHNIHLELVEERSIDGGYKVYRLEVRPR